MRRSAAPVGVAECRDPAAAARSKLRRKAPARGRLERSGWDGSTDRCSAPRLDAPQPPWGWRSTGLLSERRRPPAFAAANWPHSSTATASRNRRCRPHFLRSKARVGRPSGRSTRAALGGPSGLSGQAHNYGTAKAGIMKIYTQIYVNSNAHSATQSRRDRTVCTQLRRS